MPINTWLMWLSTESTVGDWPYQVMHKDRVLNMIEAMMKFSNQG